jgi:tyrosine-protein kinase Etk/Wzc
MEDIFQDPSFEGESIHFKKYLRGILKRWWIVLILTCGVSVPWLIYLKKQPPEYLAEVWVAFDNLTGNTPKNVVEIRRKILLSRTFAEKVTADMGLTVQLGAVEEQDSLKRGDVFKAVRTGKDQISGDYELRFHPSGKTAIYREGILKDSVETEKLVTDTFRLNGFSFMLHPAIPGARRRIGIRVNDFLQTAKSLIAREDVRFDETGSQMKIVVRDRDPVLASETVNMLAGIFVDEILRMRRDANKLKSTYLEEQLRLVQGDLNQSDAQIKSFRDTHIKGLDEETQETATRLTQVDNEINRLNRNKSELQSLLDKLNPQSPNFEVSVSARYIYPQISELAVFSGDADMGIVRQEFRDINSQRTEMLRRGVPELNKDMVDLSDRLNNLEFKIIELAEQKIKDLEGQIAGLTGQRSGLQATLNAIPQEELRLKQLSRQRQANEQLALSLLKNYKEAQLSEEVAAENVHIIDPALPPQSPVTGDKRTRALLGVLMGCFLGLCVALAWEISDKSIRTREDVKRFLKLPILGSIPKVKFDTYEFQDSEKAKSISSQIVTHDYSPTPVGEAYRELRTNLLFSKSIGTMKSLVIGSMAPSEGKSFTSANLAITLAQQKSKTLLIDADLRRGVLQNTFNVPKKPGLTNYLTGVLSLNDILRETYIPNLSLITCGSMIPNPSEILGSMRMRKFIEGITKRFDFVIFDTPPLNAATDAVVLGTLVDGVAIILRAGQTNGEEVRKRLELFENVQARIVGVILNGAGVEVAHEGYSYYKY